MFNADLETVFDKVGLKPSEGKVYLACLKSPAGGLHVKEIASQVEIPWSSVKLILERLEDKGFITHHTEENRKVYSAESPAKVLYNLQETADSFKTIMPLLSISQFGGKPSKVRFYEGKEVVREVYDDILMVLKYAEGAKKEYLAISSTIELREIDPEYMDRWIEKRVKEKISLRWIARKAEMEHEPFSKTQEYLRKIKLIDEKKYPFHMELAIYGDSIALMSLEEIPAGIIIENEKLASSFRSIFNFFWDSLP